MERTTDFFKDEVKDGFYVPTAIKQAWAAELDVLSVIDAICKRHDISYFAAWGTLLGAVRHGGFIPWDDDLDICMKRDDYIRFREAAKTELPPDFCIHDYESHENHWLFLSRVVNGAQINFDEAHLKKTYNFPWLACVDIFILDYLYPDADLEKQRDQEVSGILSFADDFIQGKIRGKEADTGKHLYESRYGITLPSPVNPRDFAVALYRLAEQQMARVSPAETDLLGQIFPWVLKGKEGIPKAVYEKDVYLPFSETMMPVPSSYHRALSYFYGDYLIPHKDWNGHNYPFFEEQRKTMERLAGEPVLRFTFKKEMKNPIARENRYALKRMVKKCLSELSEEQKNIRTLLSDADENRREKARGILMDCQQYAVALGNQIEQLMGKSNERTVGVIKSLEAYCEAVYQAFWTIGTEEDLTRVDTVETALSELQSAAEENILKRREILFLPVSAAGVRDFAAYLDEEKRKENTDVSVVPLPLFQKDIYGREFVTESEYFGAVDLDGYPEDVGYVDWESYNVSKLCPDTIYIQYPYDEENPYLTIPTAFYAKNLKKYTDRLIYVPCLSPDDFSAEDEKAAYCLSQSAASSAVIYADEIHLPSACLMERYTEALRRFADPKTAKTWGKKMRVRMDAAEAADGTGEAPKHPAETAGALSEKQPAENTPPKTLLFCLGLNELSEHGEALCAAISSRLKIMDEAKNDLKTAFCLYPESQELWQKQGGEAAEQLLSLLPEPAVLPADPEEAAKTYTAYYGSPSPYIPAFVREKKPVMVADFSVTEED